MISAFFYPFFRSQRIFIFSLLFFWLISLATSSFAQSSGVGAPSWAQTNLVDIPNQAVDIPHNITDKLLPKEMVSRPESANDFKKSAEEFLPPEKAFEVSTRLSAEEIVLTLTPSKDYYVYRDKIFAINVGSNADNQALQIQQPLPQGTLKNDPTFGQVQVFHEAIDIHVVRSRLSSSKFEFHYQGCHIKGLCYNPIIKTYELKDNSLVEVANAALPQLDSPNINRNFSLFENTGHTNFAEKNIFLVIASFFLFGLLLSLTPCVLPMVPVLFSIISGYQKKHAGSKKTGFYLALLYVLGMSLTYTLAGVVAALTGSLASNILQNIWVLGTISLLFVVLALSMFGVYTLQVPLWLQNKLNQISDNAPQNAKIAVFVMGAVSSLVLGPCVAAPMAGALLYIGQTKDIWLGASALFFLSLGMGLPLILISAGAHALLPKTGAWMKIVSVLLGFLLLAMALYIIQPFMNPAVYLSSAALLIAGVGVFLFYSTKILHIHLKKYSHIFSQLLGIVFFVYAVLLAVGAYQGANSILRPLIAKN